MKALQALINRQDDLAKIAKHYGLRHQLGKLSEELNELDAEVKHSLNYCNGEVTAAIQEEAADVIIMLAQLSYLIDVSGIANIVPLYTSQKIDRQLKRIGVQK